MGILADNWRSIANSMDAMGLKDQAAVLRQCALDLERWPFIPGGTG